MFLRRREAPAPLIRDQDFKMDLCKSVRIDEEFGAEGAKFTNTIQGTSNFTKFRQTIDWGSTILFSEI